MWSSTSQRDLSFHHGGGVHWQCVSGDNTQKLLLLSVVFHSNNQVLALEELVQPIQTKDCLLSIFHIYPPSSTTPNGTLLYQTPTIFCLEYLNSLSVTPLTTSLSFLQINSVNSKTCWYDITSQLKFQQFSNEGLREGL